MRLMGTSRLLEFTERNGDAVQAAVRALHAELKALEWTSKQDVLASYPSAATVGNRIKVKLDEQHCVVVAINYALGIALVEFAGDQNQVRESTLASSEKQI